MAKIAEGYLPPFVGTRDNITIYLMNGEYIVRSKSSLTGKRVKRDPAFARTMAYAGWLKKASRIASVVYRLMPEGRKHKQYRELVGKAMGLLKHGLSVDEVLGVLELVYLPDELFDELYEGELEDVNEGVLEDLSEEYAGNDGDSDDNVGCDNIVVVGGGRAVFCKRRIRSARISDEVMLYDRGFPATIRAPVTDLSCV